MFQILGDEADDIATVTAEIDKHIDRNFQNGHVTILTLSESLIFMIDKQIGRVIN